MASVSGTLGQTVFTNAKIIEHAFRRCSVLPERLGAEQIGIARDLLYLIMQEWTNAGFPLWTRQFNLLPIAIGSPTVQTLDGTLDVFHTYWREFNPYRGNAILTGSVGNTSLFSGAPATDVTISSPNPSATVNFTTQTQVNTVGVLLGGNSSITTALQLNTSTDGVSFTLAQTLPSATYKPGVWTYFDLDPFLTSQYLQIEYAVNATWTLNALNFCLANGTDVEIGPLNIDDYWNLPNKQFSADRANSAYLDRRLAKPVILAWPVPNVSAFYNGTIAALSRRVLMDVGAMTNIIEAPPRWYEAGISRLATRLIESIPDALSAGAGDASVNPTAGYLTLQAKQAKFQRLEQQATKAEMLAWSEERTRAPIRLLPGIGPYTK